MTDAQYSLVVAMLLAGGLPGALAASYLSDRFGRRRALLASTALMGTGSLILTVATSITSMMAGRFVAGLGSGVVTVVVPAYIAECVPKSTRGFFGTLNQLAIVVGILIAQTVGMAWSTLAAWRFILALGIVLAAAQGVLLPFCVESPKYYLASGGSVAQAKAALRRLRGGGESVEDEVDEWRSEQQQHQEEGAAARPKPAAVNVIRFLKSPQYRRPLCIILLLQLTQQFSGINAVIFYSTSIMSVVFPDSSDRITVLISYVNLIMTCVSAYLMDRAGRRTLFLVSASLMAVMSLLLGWSIDTSGHEMVSAWAIVGFVAAFAVGLGPIPFLMIPELVETQAVSSAGSVGLASNMVSNFVVSAGFLGLRDMIGSNSVFYLFGIVLIAMCVTAYYILPETKGRSQEEVVRSHWAIYPQQAGYQPIDSPRIVPEA